MIEAVNTMPSGRDIEMTKPDFTIRSGWLTFSAVAAVAAVAGALLCAVVLLFQSRGTTTEQWLMAERACAHYLYRTEREACLQQWRYMPLKR